MKDLELNGKLLHLYRRAALCAIPEENISLHRSIDKLFEDSERFQPIKIPAISDQSQPAEMRMENRVSEVAKKEMKQVERGRLRDLNTGWIGMMTSGEAVLRERMSLFWHGHFACRSVIPVFVESYINTIRKYSLGNFGEMLMAVSKEPAMLQFLNNQQNRKNSPNENFARELMELFTMGRGKYSESDVKESARSFTGWAFNAKGEFQFRERTHDTGVKDFLGQQGTFTGEDIIRILLSRKETAVFITGKIYRTLVSEVPDQKRIDNLAEGFYNSNYDISKLLLKIFKSDWFYDSSVQNALIKSPVELLVGIQRTVGASFNNPQAMLFIQKALGQVLFNPPNVAGWPGGKNWIDSSSLLFRMQLPALMFGGAEASVKIKDSGDDNDPFGTKRGKNFKVEANWSNWAAKFEKTPSEKLPMAIAFQLLAKLPNEEVMKLIGQKTTLEADRVQTVRQITQAIMSLPEYQVA